MYTELIERLREDAEWAAANEWETPITLGDHLTEAADAIEKLAKDFAMVDGLLHDRDIEIDELEQVKRELAAYKRVFDEAAILNLAGQALGIQPDRLRELAQTYKESRCVVLPCKRDDTLWTFRTYPNRAVYKFKVTDISTLNGRTMLNTDIMGVIDARDVGKTVFLTREEAEVALEAMSSGGKCDNKGLAFKGLEDRQGNRRPNSYAGHSL